MPIVDRGQPDSPGLFRETMPLRKSVGEEQCFTYESGSSPLAGFTIKRGIGRGGFGEVYYALSEGGKEVALKWLCRHLDVELRGIQHCLNLKHPNLLMIYDVRRDTRGDTWVVMEYIHGPSLEQVLASRPQGLTPEEALVWLRGMAAGVAYLHNHGIVHRDLKPGNVFWEEGVVKVGDYGLAKYISCSRRSGQTQSVGTVHYMAPEIAHGRYGKEIDIYAMGIILYEMLTGKLPFDGESAAEILMKHLTAQPDLAPLPPEFRRVIGKALEKDPERRYRSVVDMLADLPRLPVPAGFVGPIPGVSETVNRGALIQPDGGHTRPAPAASAEGSPLPGAAPVILAEEVGGTQGGIFRPIKQTGRRMLAAWHNWRVAAPIKIALLIGALLLVTTHLGFFLLVAVSVLMIALMYRALKRLFRRHGGMKQDEGVVEAEVVEPASIPERSAVPPIAIEGPFPPPTRAEAFHRKLAAMPLRAHVAELLGSLLATVLVAAVVALAGYLVHSFRGHSLNLLQGAWLYLMTIFGCWVVLILAKLWQGREGDVVLRRFLMMVVGFALGTIGYGLADYLHVDLPFDPRWPVIHDWDPPPIFYRDGQPLLPAMIAAFGTLFLLVRWWRLADPLRNSRFSFWGVFGPAIAAVITSAVWVFPAQWLIIPAIAMGITLQLAAPWFTSGPFSQRVLTRATP